MAFEKLPPRLKGGNETGVKTIATITGQAARPILVIGVLLVEAGFQTDRKYEMHYDRETVTLALEPVPKKDEFHRGQSVQKKPNQHGQKASYLMSAIRFCKYFGLKHRYEALSAEWDGKQWVLPLRRTTRDE